MQPLRLVAPMAVISWSAVAFPVTSYSQSCELPAIPNATVTSAQDRDHMLCALDLVQRQFYGQPIDPNIPIQWEVSVETTGVQVVGGTSYPYREKTFTGTVDISSGAALFDIDATSGEITIANASGIDFSKASYALTVIAGDGKLPSHDAEVTIKIPEQINVCHQGRTFYVPKHKVPDHLSHGDAIGGCPKH